MIGRKQGGFKMQLQRQLADDSRQVFDRSISNMTMERPFFLNAVGAIGEGD